MNKSISSNSNSSSRSNGSIVIVSVAVVLGIVTVVVEIVVVEERITKPKCFYYMFFSVEHMKKMIGFFCKDVNSTPASMISRSQHQISVPNAQQTGNASAHRFMLQHFGIIKESPGSLKLKE